MRYKAHITDEARNQQSLDPWWRYENMVESTLKSRLSAGSEQSLRPSPMLFKTCLGDMLFSFRQVSGSAPREQRAKAM